MKRELQVAFETDPHLHGLGLGGMPERIKIEVDEQEPEQEPETQEYPEYPGCEYFDHLRVGEDDEDFYNAPVSTGSTGFLQDPIVRGLDFHSDVGWIRPRMVRNGW